MVFTVRPAPDKCGANVGMSLVFNVSLLIRTPLPLSPLTKQWLKSVALILVGSKAIFIVVDHLIGQCGWKMPLKLATSRKGHSV